MTILREAMASGVREFLSQVEEALLARTLLGRRLERDVLEDDGGRLFAAGREIDQPMLDRARELGRLEELAHAAEPGTSDSELEEFLWWRKHRHDADPPAPEA